jgi:O-acetylhomoserine (thiol)-lyase
MRSETIAIHSGYDIEPTTKAVAVPIYQTVAYAFDSAEHGAALFNLDVDGFRYTRINNPTNAVLERRVAALEGGVEALCVSSGQAALNYAALNVTQMGSNIVSVPQLYGTTHTLFAHVLPSQGVDVRLAESDKPEAIARLIDENTKAVFCESVGNPAGNICDLEALAIVAHQAGVPLIVDNTVATPILLRPIEYGADIVVHSLTKFMGGHGTTLGGIIVDSGRFPWKEHARRFPTLNQPDPSYHGLIYTEHFGESAFIARCRSVYQRATGAVLSPLSAFLLLQGIETVALRIERHVENAKRVAEFLRSDARVEWVNYAGFSDSPYHAGAKIPGRPGLLSDDIRCPGRIPRRRQVLRRLQAHQASGQHGRCKIARLPSGFDDAPPDDARRAMQSRRKTRDDPAQHRHRAHR